MIDLLIGLVSDNADEIINFVKDLLIGGAAIAATVLVVHEVKEKITRINLPSHIIDAIYKNNRDIFKKIIGIVIKAKVSKNKGDEITIDEFESDCPELKGQQITIKSPKGIDPSLKAGDEIKFKVLTIDD